MTLREKWYVVNKLRDSKLDIWQYDSIDTSNNSKCNITLQLNTWGPSIWERLSDVYLYNLPKSCGKELKSIFNRQGKIILNQIIDVLVNHGCQPKITNGKKSYGYTKSKTEWKDCVWYIYVL